MDDAWSLRQNEFPLYSIPYVKMFVMNGTLPLSEVILTEKCLGGCSFCGSVCGPRAPSLPWSLLEAVFKSTQLDLKATNIFMLGGGEVLHYRDGQKRLIDAVALSLENGVTPSLTTAGLLPQNRKAGTDFFRSLKSLGFKKDGVRVDISVNLIDGWRNSDPESYLAAMRETLQSLASTNCFFRVLRIRIWNQEAQRRIYGPAGWRLEDRLDTFLKDMETELGFTTKERQLYPVGKALGDPRFAPLFSHVSCGDSTCYFESDIIPPHRQPPFSMTAQGKIITGCNFYGNFGTPLGDVSIHDAIQIHRAFHAFYPELLKIQDQAKDERFNKCEAHRRWHRDFSPQERSANPIVPRALVVR